MSDDSAASGTGSADQGSAAAGAAAAGAGNIDAAQAASFNASLNAAKAEANAVGGVSATDKNHGTAHVTNQEQAGYGDIVGGVAISDLGNRTEAEIVAKIDEHMGTYEPAQNPNALKDALDLAVAYKAQGGSVDFGRIQNDPKLDGRAQAEVAVAERRANILASASGSINALNDEGINYGAELYQTLKTVDNAQPDTVLAGDPSEAMAFGLILDQQVARRQHLSGVDIVKDTAFQQVMSAAGYDNLFAEARRTINLMDDGTLRGSKPGSRPGWVGDPTPSIQVNPNWSIPLPP